MIARSTNKKFRKTNLPCIWDTEEDALRNAPGNALREIEGEVEDKVEGEFEG